MACARASSSGYLAGTRQEQLRTRLDNWRPWATGWNRQCLPPSYQVDCWTKIKEDEKRTCAQRQCHHQQLWLPAVRSSCVFRNGTIQADVKISKERKCYKMPAFQTLEDSVQCLFLFSTVCWQNKQTNKQTQTTLASQWVLTSVVSFILMSSCLHVVGSNLVCGGKLRSQAFPVSGRINWLFFVQREWGGSFYFSVNRNIFLKSVWHVCLSAKVTGKKNL